MYGGGYGKGQAHLHACGVGAKGHVDEVTQAGEVDDFFNALVDLGWAHAHHDGAQADVFAPGGFGVDAQTDVDERDTLADDVRLAMCGVKNAGQHAQQGGFAGAVVANQAHAFSRPDFQGDALQSFDDHGAVMLPVDMAAGYGAEYAVFEREAGGVVNGEVDRGVFEFNRCCGGAHSQ